MQDKLPKIEDSGLFTPDGIYGWEKCYKEFMKIINSQPDLVPLDEKELCKWIMTSDWENISSPEIAKQLCSKFRQPKQNFPSVENILKSMDSIPSTHVPISKIGGKTYFYMCKEEIAQAIHNLLIKGE